MRFKILVTGGSGVVGSALKSLKFSYPLPDSLRSNSKLFCYRRKRYPDIACVCMDYLLVELVKIYDDGFFRLGGL